ncbi:MAG TPA: c-type cytochrome domain-containing protein [Gemmataceae bacterium]|nr:c-type cytochrome domain-containing protein [Gemmataceae bacterium]
MKWLQLLTLLGLPFLTPLWAVAQEKKKDAPLPNTVSYFKDVRPILQQHCQGCHQPAMPKGGYVMTDHGDLFKKTENDHLGIVAGQPAKSELYLQIISQNGKKPEMPRGKDPLSPRDVALVGKWIEQGAKDDTPASAKMKAVDADHPPIYVQPPVIDGLAFSKNGDLLAVTGYHEVLLHKGDGTGLVARLIGVSERVQSLAFSPDGKWLAVTGGNPGRFGEIQIWNVEKRKLKLSIPVTFDTIYGASWSPDSKMIAFGCADNSLRAIDAETGKQVLFQGGHGDWVLDTVFSVKGTHLVSVSRDRSMKLTEIATERLEDNITSITPGALKGGLQAVDRHPAKDELLIGGADGTPKLYQMFRTKARVIGDDFNNIRNYPALPGRLFAVKFSPDGNRIVAGSSSDGKGEVRVYETNTAKPVSTFKGINGPIYALAYAPKGDIVASAGFEGIVHLNDATTGALIRDFVPVPIGGKK